MCRAGKVAGRRVSSGESVAGHVGPQGPPAPAGVCSFAGEVPVTARTVAKSFSVILTRATPALVPPSRHIPTTVPAGWGRAERCHVLAASQRRADLSGEGAGPARERSESLSAVQDGPSHSRLH